MTGVVKKLRGATCLVTGGAGAIGSRLVRLLLDRDVARIVVIDDLSSGYEWLLPRDQRVSFQRADVVDITPEELMLPEAFVFHLAAFFANQNSVDHPRQDLRTNGLGTLAVLDWASRSQSRIVVYASAGCSIAGHGLDVPIREDMPVSLHLDTPYQITKALGEFYCNYYDQDVPTVRCRFFNSFGPGEVPGKYRNVIPNFIWWALNDLPLTITGTGDETRDFIYVDDLAGGLISAAVNDAARGHAINLGTGHQTRIADLAEAVIRLTGSKSKIVHLDRRPWDKSTSREADISRARELIGLEAEVSFEEGLERTVRWFQDHRRQIENSVDRSPARAIPLVDWSA